MFSHTESMRVRYADTDQMGYVYYGNYARYYEIARVEALRRIGISYKSLEESGVMMPVADFRIKYLRPARYDDWLAVTVTVKTLPDRRITFDYEVRNEANELINVGSTVLVFVDKQTGKSCEPPDHVRQIMAAYFETT